MEGRRRNSLRLQEWDYSVPGSYFVTICVHDRLCLFGKVDDGMMTLSVAGMVIDSWWGTIPRRFPGVNVDAHIVMPNHLHGIVMLEPTEDGMGRAAGKIDLADVMQWFKSVTTKDYRRGVETEGWQPFNARLWQRGYHDHIVRDDRDLDRIRKYIEANPGRWAEDEENPTNS